VDNFTLLSNAFLRDGRLTFKARGLGGWLLSHSETFEFSIERIAELNKDGVSAVRTGLLELEELGYLTREDQRDDRGRVVGTVYTVTDCLPSSGPSCDFPTTDNQSAENRRPYKKSTSKKITKEEDQPSGGVAVATPEVSPALPEEEHMRRKNSQDEMALFEEPVSPTAQPAFNGGTLVATYLASYARHFGGARPGKATIGQVSRAAKVLVESGDWSEIELISAADALGATAFAGLERQAMMARKSSRGPSKIVQHGDETWSTPAAAQARLVEDDEFMSRWLAEQSARDQVTA
jgi:hypothetical protein